MLNTRPRLLLAFLFRIGAAGGSVLLSVLTARAGGPGALADLTIFLAVIGAGGLIARRGMTDLLVRNVARLSLQGTVEDRQSLLFSYSRSTWWTLLGALAIGAFVILHEYRGAHVERTMVAFWCALPALTFLTLFASYLTGRGMSWLSPAFDQGGTSLVAALILIALRTFITLTPEADFALSAAALSVIALFWLRRERTRSNPGTMKQPTNPIDNKVLGRGQAAFMITGLTVYLSQVGSFLLAAPFLTTYELGLLRGAERLALLVSFSILVLNPFVAPNFVRLAQEHKRKHLKTLLYKTMGLAGIIGAAPCLLLLLAPQWPLSLLGPAFTQAQGYLRALAFTHLAVAVLSPATMLLNMTGGERIAMYINTVFLLISLIAFPLTAELWGAAGFVAIYSLIAVVRIAAIFLAAHATLREETA